MKEKEDRPAIPQPIQRQVRQECRFGCALCGKPVFHYDHIIEYNIVKEHKAENLVLLCEEHHGAKTTGKLSVDRVLEAKRNPFNVNRPTTSTYKVEPNRTIDVNIGTNKASKQFLSNSESYNVLWINGHSFLQVHYEEGWLSISAKLTDPEGNYVLLIDRGEMVVSSEIYDYTYEGTRLTIHRQTRKIILDVDLSSGGITVYRGLFLDKNQDGFLVVNDGFFSVKGGKNRSFYSGNSSNDNGFAAYAVLHSNLFGSFPPRLSGVGFMEKW